MATVDWCKPPEDESERCPACNRHLAWDGVAHLPCVYCAGRKAERERIVAWLRKQFRRRPCTLYEAADAIEKGEDDGG
jgi:hypothetical protein